MKSARFFSRATVGRATLHSDACASLAGEISPSPGRVMAKAGRARSLTSGASASSRKSLAAARAAGGDDLAAADGRHARAKAVAALAHDFGRLIGPLHAT